MAAQWPRSLELIIFSLLFFRLLRATSRLSSASRVGAVVPRAQVKLLTSQNVLLGTSETDRDGRYVKKDLEPGSYILKVSRAAFEPQVAKVSVASKKTTDLELVLRLRSRAQAPPSPQATSTSQAQGNAIRSAIEETGATWIKNLGKRGR